MKAGHPLNDADRKQWLDNLDHLAVEQTTLKGAVIACSALKEKYRSTLTNGVAQPIWIFLQGSYDLIYKRIEKRAGHFMPAALLQSQFDSLEVPENAFTVNIEKEPGEIVALIIQHLKSIRAI
jgi:carbohydrate kinase (thermoresistant glucokinase family)